MTALRLAAWLVSWPLQGVGGVPMLLGGAAVAAADRLRRWAAAGARERKDVER